MPNFGYGHNYPFAAYITNLGKYNEGVLVGEWLKFPATADDLKGVFERIGIGSRDEFGQVYEEWFISDYDCYVDGLYEKLGEYADLDSLNYLASLLDDMNDFDLKKFEAAMELDSYLYSIKDMINLAQNLDCYELYSDIHNEEDLGRYYIDIVDCVEVPPALQGYIDYEAYGRDVAMGDNSEFTDYGYIVATGNSTEYFDGTKEDIPEEYLLTRAISEDDEEEE